MNKIKLSLLVAIFCFCYSYALGAIADDAVLSQHIRDADGTSGQNTGSGSGVKTGHIQDGAVTNSKIADASVGTAKIVDAAVTTTKLSDNAVTNVKITDGAVTDTKISGQISSSKISTTGLNADMVDGKHAAEFASAVHFHSQSDIPGLTDALASKADSNHSHSGGDISDGTIGTSKLAAGAVADDKITGPISTSKLNVGTITGTVAAGDHNHDSVYQGKYANVVVVAKSGGDYTSLGTALGAVNPSADNPVLIKVMPGIYEEHFIDFSGKSYFHIQGAGRDVTKIEDSVWSGTPLIISEGSNYSISGLTIKGSSFGLYINASSDFTIRDCQFSASQGLRIDSSSGRILNNVIMGPGYGVVVQNSTVAIETNFIHDAGGSGLFLYSSTGRVTGNTIINNHPGYGDIQLSGENSLLFSFNIFNNLVGSASGSTGRYNIDIYGNDKQLL